MPDLLHVEATERICNTIVNPTYVLGRNCEVSPCSHQKQGTEEGHHVGATGGATTHARDYRLIVAAKQDFPGGPLMTPNCGR